MTIADLDAVPRDVSIIPNLRVSKQGGLMRALDVLARPPPGPVIVGAQEGATSILARAGLALAHAAGDRLQGFEGGYGPLLLSRDVGTPSLGFGFSGHARQGGMMSNDTHENMRSSRTDGCAGAGCHRTESRFNCNISTWPLRRSERSGSGLF